MRGNWSLIFNVLLLVGVIVAIGRLMNARRQSLSAERYSQPPTVDKAQNSPYDAQPFSDDIISVRKVSDNVLLRIEPETALVEENILPKIAPKPKKHPLIQQEEMTFSRKQPVKEDAPPTLMMFLLAKESRLFAGYELLQTVLATGLRFGDGNLFHRHQFDNGQGPVLCSLAAATATGTFDLQNIGAFAVRGLCLFMRTSNNPNIDAERFTLMLETARQLSEGLDAHLLDFQRKPLTEERLAQYYQLLNKQHHTEGELVS